MKVTRALISSSSFSHPTIVIALDSKHLSLDNAIIYDMARLHFPSNHYGICNMHVTSKYMSWKSFEGEKRNMCINLFISLCNTLVLPENTSMNQA